MPIDQNVSRREFLKRAIGVGVGLPTASLLLAGCPAPSNLFSSATSNQAEEPQSSAATDAPSGMLSFLISGDNAEQEAYKTVVTSFQQRNPDVQVDQMNVPNANDYRKRLAADFAANTPPDVFLLNYRRYASFAKRKKLELLDAYIAASHLIKKDDFYPESIQPYIWQGALIGIPQNISSLVIYYNKDLFDRAGLDYPQDDWTWDDFLQTAQALTVDNDGDGLTDVYGLGTEAAIFRVTPFIWMNGGDLVDDRQKPTRLDLDRPETREALQWFIDLLLKHKVVPNAIEEQAEISESRFINGRLAMFFNSRRGTPTYRTIQTFDWDVAPLPHGKEQVNILHSDAFCMAASCPNKATAWAFIESANSEEGQTVLAKTGRTVPSLKAVAESPAFLDPTAKPKNSRVFLDSIPYLRAVPITETWIDIEIALSREFELAFHGDATLDAAIDGAKVRTIEFFR